MALEEKEKSCLTINGCVYKTSGNIVFHQEDEGRYFVAESRALENIDKAIQEGILGNGMRALMRKVRV
jgi:hypothetical protein